MWKSLKLCNLVLKDILKEEIHAYVLEWTWGRNSDYKTKSFYTFIMTLPIISKYMLQ